MELIYRLSPSSLVAGFIAALGFLLLAWDSSAQQTMMWWFVAALGVFGVRLFILWLSKQHNEQREPNLTQWEYEQIIAAVLIGCLWGSLFGLVAPLTQINPYVYFMVAVVILLTSVPMLSILMPAFWATTIPAVIGISYLVVVTIKTNQWTVLVLMIALATTVYVTLTTYRQLIDENVKYRLTNARLTAEMMVTLEDPNAAVLRVLKGDVRYANERMSELTGLSVDTVMRSSIADLLGPGPWSDPNWTQLKQALAHGLPQTFNWWLPNANGDHRAVRVRTRGVWDFSQSHGGVMLFSPLSPAPLFSTSAASESLPILVDHLPDWLTYARIDRRKRSANPVMLAVLRPSPSIDFDVWRKLYETQLLRRMSARELICFNASAAVPEVYLWLSATVRDLTADQLRSALISSLTVINDKHAVMAPEEVAQLEDADGAELAVLRHAGQLQVGVALVDHSTEPDEALERAKQQLQAVREGRASNTSKPQSIAKP
jgi:PAS domain-containing protein